MEERRTEYARLGEISLAYQVVGDGPIDLVYVPPFTSHCEFIWTLPEAARFLRRLASFSRLILFDKQGTGLSDPVPEPATVEQRAAEIGAIMDAVGSKRAALFAASEAGSASISFSITSPDRVSHLILYGSYPRIVPDEEFFPELTDYAEEMVSSVAVPALETWGSGAWWGGLFAPSIANDPRAVARLGAWERASASPGMARATLDATFQIDVRNMLGDVTTPTLVLHRRGDRAHPIEIARYMAERIPGARMVDLDGDDYLPWIGDTDAIVGEVREFVTGTRAGRDPDRILATVLFTDIVGSTERVAELGDERWGALLEDHDAAARAQVERFAGSFVKSTGDGALAMFEDPTDAIRAAQGIANAAAGLGLAITAGIHTGQCALIGDDVGGIAVHIGARVAGLADPGEILVSRTVRDLVAGSGLHFDDRGEHELKGVPERWPLYAVAS